MLRRLGTMGSRLLLRNPRVGRTVQTRRLRAFGIERPGVRRPGGVIGSARHASVAASSLEGATERVSDGIKVEPSSVFLLRDLLSKEKRGELKDALRTGKLRRLLDETQLHLRTSGLSAEGGSLVPEVTEILLPLHKLNVRHALVSDLGTHIEQGLRDGTFTADEATKMLWVLVRLGSTDTVAQVTRAMVETLGVNPEFFTDPKHHSLMAFALAKTSLPTDVAGPAWEALLAGLETMPEQQWAAMQPRSVATLCWALANGGMHAIGERGDDRRDRGRASRVLRRLVAAAGNLGAFSARDLVTAVSSVAKCDVYDATLFEAATARLLSQPLDSLSAWDATHVVWALAHVWGEIPVDGRRTYMPLLKGVRDDVLLSRMSRLSSRQVSVSLWSLATVNAVSLAMATSALKRLATVGCASAQEASNVAWAIAHVRQPRRVTGLAAFWDSLDLMAHQQTSSFTTQGLTNIAWASAKLHRGAQLVEHVAAEMERRATHQDSWRPHELAMILWSLAKVGSHDSGMFVRLLRHHVRPHLDDLDCVQVATVAWAAMQHSQQQQQQQPPPQQPQQQRLADKDGHASSALQAQHELLEDACQLLRARAPESTPVRTLCHMAWVVARAGHKTLNQFLLFSAISQRVMDDPAHLSPRDWASVVWAFSRLENTQTTFFQFAMEHIPPLDHFAPFHLRQLAYALTGGVAHSGVPPPPAQHAFYSRLENNLTSQSPQFPPSWIADIVYWLSLVPEHQLGDDLLDMALEVALSPAMDNARFFEPLALAWSLGQNGRDIPPPLVERVVLAVDDALSDPHTESPSRLNLRETAWVMQQHPKGSPNLPSDVWDRVWEQCSQHLPAP